MSPKPYDLTQVQETSTYSWDGLYLYLKTKNGLMDFVSRYAIDLDTFNLPVVLLDTVTDCSGLFEDFSIFNQPIAIPEIVKDCTAMFKNCKCFSQTVDIPEGVENTTEMFAGCEALNRRIRVPLSVKNCKGMFSGCDNLTCQIVIPAKFCKDAFESNNTTELTSHFGD